MDSAFYWLWLADAVSPGFRASGRLLAEWPDPADLYAAVREGVMPSYLTAGTAERLRRTDPCEYEERLDHCRRSGITVLTPDDPDFPPRLRSLSDAPLVLYVTGSTAALSGQRYVGMVGTRRPTAYGKQACHDLSLTLARQGMVIVSGLADGLDGVGHRAAVEAGAKTVAFLGTAIDKTYPAVNGRLRQELEALGGCTVSEFYPGFPGRMKGTFLARNRLIAGLSEVLCVAEARLKSGTLNTVSHAERYGRPVLAVPGSIYSPVSEGTNDLLRTGRAKALCSAADLLREMGGPLPAPAAPERPALPPLSDGARALAEYLGPEPRTVSELCRTTGLPVQQVLAGLMELELAGLAAADSGRRYTLK